jgi:hypothetical protein
MGRVRRRRADAVIRVTINDIAAEFRRFEARKSGLFKPLRSIVVDLARQAKAEVKAAIRRKKAGRVYGGGIDRKNFKFLKVDGRRRLRKVTIQVKRYTASAPGDAPASRTGVLLNSIRSARMKRSVDFGFFIFANSRTAFYRHWLEFGTKARRRGKRGNAGRIEKRPLFTPLAMKYERLLATRIDRELPAALRELLR